MIAHLIQQAGYAAAFLALILWPLILAALTRTRP